MAVIQQSDFYGETSLLHPLVVGSIILCIVFAYLRITSSRSLNPTTITSYVCSVAIGSTVSRIVTQPGLDLTRGVLSIFIIFFFEWVSTKLAASGPKPFAYIFQSPPCLLVFRGKADMKAIRNARVSPSGLMQALRTKGMLRLDQAEAVILEPNGSFAVFPRLSSEDLSGSLDSLECIPGYSAKCEEWENREKQPREPKLDPWIKGEVLAEKPKSNGHSEV